MPITELEIWNMALSLSQERATITSPTETGRLPDLCRLWYDRARRRVLKSGAWPCATKIVYPALQSERDFNEVWVQADPAPGFCYAYTQPNDLLAPQRLENWGRFDRVFMNGAPCIVTDTEQAILRYTFDQEEVNFWDEGLVLTVATFMASLICRNINGKLGLSDRLTNDAQAYALESQTEYANEASLQYKTVPDNILQRGYSGAQNETRYYYPFEQLNGNAT